MNPRLLRLQADYELVSARFAAHPRIRVDRTEGTPPDRYVFTVAVPGLIPAGENALSAGSEHTVEIYLPSDYPRRPPFCRMLTPVFHPNIDPQKICIGDHWSAGQPLAEMVLRIAEMICFQSYNLKSPLNAAAAAWAEQNVDRLPLESADLDAAADSPPAPAPPAPAAPA